MKQYMFDNSESVALWVAKQMNVNFTEVLGTIGILDGEGVLIGGAVLHNYTRYDVELSYFGKGTLDFAITKAIGWIAFVKGGVERLTLCVPRKRKRLLRALPKIGFHHEGIQRRKFGPNKSDDGILFGMLREEAAKYHVREENVQGTKVA